MTGHDFPHSTLEVAHLFPQSYLNQTNYVAQSFLKRICPWIGDDFFDKLDSCENAILLNIIAHQAQGAFKWFIVMEPGDDGDTVYKAMQVVEDGLLRDVYDYLFN